jgi:hypothetical protein
MKYLQASLALSIYCQLQARNLLLLALGMRCHHKCRGRLLFFFTLFNYLQKVRKTKILIGVDFLFMTIFPEQEVHHTIPLAINHTFDSPENDWCYENTRFTVDQLRLIHLYLDLPPNFVIREGRVCCSSEEAFIVMMVKLATGFDNTRLCHLFGEFMVQQISGIYCYTISLLDSNAETFLHGPGCIEQWTKYFPDFAAMIEQKLADKAYGR